MCPRLITSPHPSLVLTTLNTLQLFRHTSPSLVSTGVPQKTNPVPVSPCVWLSLLSSRFSVSVEWMNVQQGVHENHQLVLFPKKARDVCLYSRSISRPWCTLSWTIRQFWQVLVIYETRWCQRISIHLLVSLVCSLPNCLNIIIDFQLFFPCSWEKQPAI